jgi:hypothetical protein
MYPQETLTLIHSIVLSSLRQTYSVCVPASRCTVCPVSTSNCTVYLCFYSHTMSSVSVQVVQFVCEAENSLYYTCTRLGLSIAWSPTSSVQLITSLTPSTHIQQPYTFEAKQSFHLLYPGTETQPPGILVSCKSLVSRLLGLD